MGVSGSKVPCVSITQRYSTGGNSLLLTQGGQLAAAGNKREIFNQERRPYAAGAYQHRSGNDRLPPGWYDKRGKQYHRLPGDAERIVRSMPGSSSPIFNLLQSIRLPVRAH